MSKIKMYKLASLIPCCVALTTASIAEAAPKKAHESMITPSSNQYPCTCVLSIQDATKAASGTWTFQNDFPQHGTYVGFVCVFPDEGPVSLATHSVQGEYTPLQVPVQAEDGTQFILKLRGYRNNSCEQYTMNSSMGCGQTWSGATLQIDYSPDDNPNLPKGVLFVGGMPVQALDWYYSDFQQNSVVIIKIQT